MGDDDDSRFGCKDVVGNVVEPAPAAEIILVVGVALALVLGAPVTVGEDVALSNVGFTDTVGNSDASNDGRGDVEGASLNRALGRWLTVGFDVKSVPGCIDAVCDIAFTAWIDPDGRTLTDGLGVDSLLGCLEVVSESLSSEKPLGA